MSELLQLLADLQDSLRLIMISWRDHRTGRRLIQPEHAKALEDLIIEASFGLGEAQLEVTNLITQHKVLLADAQAQHEESVRMLLRAAELLDRHAPRPCPSGPLGPNVVRMFPPADGEAL